MPEFDFLLKQINEKIEKTTSKIQSYAVKIIPLEEERDRLDIAKKGLEGDIDLKPAQKRNYKRNNSSLREVILDIIKSSDAYLKTSEIIEIVQRDHGYNNRYIYVILSKLTKERVLQKDKYNKFRMSEVGPITEVKGEITADPNENTFDSFPAL